MEPAEGIKLLEQKFKSVLPRLPLLAGNEAVNFALDNFKRQGFLGHAFQPWAIRKVGWKKDRRKGRNLLIDTGRLRRSIRIVSLTQTSVTVGSDVKYAKAHNEGLRIGLIQTVKGFTRKNGSEVKPHTRRIDQRIPRRQFLGESPYLNARIVRVFTAEFMKSLK